MHLHLYYRNKIAFYKKLEQAFKEKGYNITIEKLRKKLGNMITTYKRAKDRCRSTGEGNVTWEYYKVGVLFVLKLLQITGFT